MNRAGSITYEGDLHPIQNRAAGARFCVLIVKRWWERVERGPVEGRMVQKAVVGARVCVFAKGRGVGAPQHKRSRQGSVLLLGWLTMTGMGLGGPERRGGDVFSVYFNVIERRRTCCFV